MIMWPVDNLKISHEDASVVTSIIKSLRVKYDATISLSSSRDRVKKYLGMTFYFTMKVEASIIMYDQLDDIIDNAPRIYKSGLWSTTVAPNNLYSVQPACEGNELLSDSGWEE